MFGLTEQFGRRRKPCPLGLGSESFLDRPALDPANWRNAADNPPVDPRAKYPLCVEGERACPPEDVGGALGYQDFLKTIGNRNRKKNRAETLEWAEGWFDPNEFDATTATKSMWKGLPDWRNLD